MNQGGEHTPEQQPEGHQAVHDHAVEPLGQASVQAYIEYLDEGLGRPWKRPLGEGFRWFLEDAIGVDIEELSDDEQRLMTWLAQWDHWTVQTIGTLINRSRAQAYEDGRAEAQDQDEADPKAVAVPTL